MMVPTFCKVIVTIFNNIIIIIIIIIFLLPRKLCSGRPCDEQQHTISIQKIRNYHIKWFAFFFI